MARWNTKILLSSEPLRVYDLTRCGFRPQPELSGCKFTQPTGKPSAKYSLVGLQSVPLLAILKIHVAKGRGCCQSPFHLIASKSSPLILLLAIQQNEELHGGGRKQQLERESSPANAIYKDGSLETLQLLRKTVCVSQCHWRRRRNRSPNPHRPWLFSSYHTLHR